jgi:pyruvate dehydrogenase E2 component (dihydrolipoamide acetyltransferase)
LARERGIDLAQVRGTGPGGRIIEQDVLAVVASGARSAGVSPAVAAPLPRASSSGVVSGSGSVGAGGASALPVRVGSGQKQVVPLAKIRQVIAQRLQASKQQIPHFYETIEADVEELSRTRELLNEQLESDGVRLSIGDFVVKAVACALVAHPALNSSFNGTELTRYGDVNLGVAVALPDGLIVPVLRNVNQMGLREIRQRSVDLVDRARKQKLKQDEMTGATFTVSNLGSYGIREFSAIINPPEVGILAVGAAAKRAVVHDGKVVPRTMLTLTLSADHRVVDGATAAQFMRTLKEMLEEPAAMLVV